MSEIILITGSDGLIGSALGASLLAARLRVRCFDLRRSGQDVCDLEALHSAVQDCSGIIHLAAVSRVVWGERAPELCWRTNVDGTRNILQAAASSLIKPWVLFASSREVYGNLAHLPATEDSPMQPCNVYGRSKAEGERLCIEARTANLPTAIVRLSNVYGSTRDHDDRVVPCFARRAALGEPLRVDGRRCTFDFTHLDDTVRGLMGVVGALRAGESALPPIHFLTGQPTTLGELAQLASREGGGRSEIIEAPCRSFDVTHFYGEPRRALDLLGWQPRISIREGMAQLVREFSRQSEARGGLNVEQPMEGAVPR